MNNATFFSVTIKKTEKKTKQQQQTNKQKTRFLAYDYTSCIKMIGIGVCDIL